MMIRHLVIGVAALVVASAVVAEKSVVIQRENAALRAGPGSYHPVLAHLASGTQGIILQEMQGWYRIQMDALDGYVSRRAADLKKERRDVFSEFASERAAVTVSPHSLSAAVKGFAGPIAEAMRLSGAEVDAIEAVRVDFGGFPSFQEETYRKLNPADLRRRYSLKRDNSGEGFSTRERAMGLAIAAKASQDKLLRDEEATRYLNYVGQLVVLGSSAYDLPFLFLIVKDETANALACPGGIILVTSGLLKMIQSEGELAYVLAHEVAHVAWRHGLKEMEERRVQIRSEDHFAELAEAEEAPDDPLRGVEEELGQMALDMYESIVGDRLLGYESEADETALLYGLRAGYSPQGMIDLLGRLASAQDVRAGEHYKKGHGATRLKHVKRKLAQLRPRGELLTNAGRYRGFADLLP